MLCRPVPSISPQCSVRIVPIRQEKKTLMPSVTQDRHRNESPLNRREEAKKKIPMSLSTEDKTRRKDSAGVVKMEKRKQKKPP